MTRVRGNKNSKPVTKELQAKLRRYARQAENMVILAMIRSGEWRIEEVPEDERQPLPITDDATVDTFVQTVLAVGKARREALNALKSALQRRDHSALEQAARQLVNFNPEGGEAHERKAVH